MREGVTGVPADKVGVRIPKACPQSKAPGWFTRGPYLGHFQVVGDESDGRGLSYTPCCPHS